METSIPWHEVHGRLRLEALARQHEPEPAESEELGQVRSGEGCVRQVEVFWMGSASSALHPLWARSVGVAEESRQVVDGDLDQAGCLRDPVVVGFEGGVWADRAVHQSEHAHHVPPEPRAFEGFADLGFGAQLVAAVVCPGDRGCCVRWRRRCPAPR